MPKSKRAKVTTLSKTPLRTTKASKSALVNEIRACIDRYEHVWLFTMTSFRNEGLKELRGQWRDSGRFFLGKTKVMAKALGDTVASEYQPGLHGLSKHMKGDMGLFMTSHPVDETREWFDSWSKRDFARVGSKAERDIVLPIGPILSPFTEPPSGDPLPHSMEPQLRALGLNSTLQRGVPSLNESHVLCSQDDTLTSEQCRLLQLLGVQMTELRLDLRFRWTKSEIADGEERVKEIESTS